MNSEEKERWRRRGRVGEIGRGEKRGRKWERRKEQ